MESDGGHVVRTGIIFCNRLVQHQRHSERSRRALICIFFCFCTSRWKALHPHPQGMQGFLVVIFTPVCGFSITLGGIHNWRGVWNKVLSESFCNVKFSLIFSSKYKVIWKDNMAIDQKSLKAFFHAPVQFILRVGYDAFRIFSFFETPLPPNHLRGGFLNPPQEMLIYQRKIS